MTHRNVEISDTHIASFDRGEEVTITAHTRSMPEKGAKLKWFHKERNGLARVTSRQIGRRCLYGVFRIVKIY